MKRLLFSMLCALFLLVVSAWSQDQPTQVKQGNEPYQSQVKNLAFGNPMFTRIAMQFWKDYDSNTLQNFQSNYADDVTAYLADGTVVKGRDNWMKMLTEYRNTFTNVSSNVFVSTTLKSLDNPNYEVGLLWGPSTETKKDGTTRKIYVHESFVFNPEGKIVEFRHMFAAMPKE